MARSAFCRMQCVCVHVVLRRGYKQGTDGSRRNIQLVIGTHTQTSHNEKSVILSEETHVNRQWPYNKHTSFPFSKPGLFCWGHYTLLILQVAKTFKDGVINWG